MVTVLAIAAATWAVLMALAPLLQIRRMLQRRSSAYVSVAYLLILVPGFALWVVYGLASNDVARRLERRCLMIAGRFAHGVHQAAGLHFVSRRTSPLPGQHG